MTMEDSCPKSLTDEADRPVAEPDGAPMPVVRDVRDARVTTLSDTPSHP
ncbi:hypothetical protein [Streptomyces sp. NPDC008122]